jgi:O-antigen ligase
LIISFLAIVIVCFCLAYVAFPVWMNNYVREISTIWQEGTEEETANHRLYLWSKAWDMFIDHPLLGVGPDCYGHRISMYETALERARWHVDRQQYGRAVHNIYFQTLSEMGIFGILAFVVLIYSFFKKNLQVTRFFSLRSEGSNQYSSVLPKDAADGDLQYYAIGLSVGMLAFLVNAFFFNLLYFTWFWDLIILNSLLHRRISETQSAS